MNKRQLVSKIRRKYKNPCYFFW